MHPEFDFVFLFDHSAGHARQRPDGLNQHRMNKAFGGKAVLMRDTLIQQEVYLTLLYMFIIRLFLGGCISCCWHFRAGGNCSGTDGDKEAVAEATQQLIGQY
jgi:hypothetical protein